MKRMGAVVFGSKSDADYPFVNQAGILPRAQMPRRINPAWKGVVIDRPSTPLKPSEQACPGISGQFELNGGRPVFCGTAIAPGRMSGPTTRVPILIFTRSHPRNLLSIARSNRARSRSRPSLSRKKRIAHACRGFSARLAPNIFPAFHAGCPCVAGSYCECPIVFLLRPPLAAGESFVLEDTYFPQPRAALRRSRLPAGGSRHLAPRLLTWTAFENRDFFRRSSGRTCRSGPRNRHATRFSGRCARGPRRVQRQRPRRR